MKLLDISNEIRGREFMFDCPGCEMAHSLTTTKPNSCGAQWTFNYDLDKPTFSPSLKVTHFKEDGVTVAGICHSFIRNGCIEFLSDCSHRLAGQTIILPEVD